MQLDVLQERQPRAAPRVSLSDRKRQQRHPRQRRQDDEAAAEHLQYVSGETGAPPDLIERAAQDQREIGRLARSGPCSARHRNRRGLSGNVATMFKALESFRMHARHLEGAPQIPFLRAAVAAPADHSQTIPAWAWIIRRCLRRAGAVRSKRVSARSGGISAANTPDPAIGYSGSRHTALSQPAFEQCTLSVRADGPISAFDRSAHDTSHIFLDVLASPASGDDRRRVETMLTDTTRRRLVGLWFAAIAILIASLIAMRVDVGVVTAALLLTLSLVAPGIVALWRDVQPQSVREILSAANIQAADHS